MTIQGLEVVHGFSNTRGYMQLALGGGGRVQVKLLWV